MPEDSEGRVHPNAANVIIEILPRFDAMVVGSGLGQSENVSRFVEALLLTGRTPELPVLVDADGLNSLSRNGKWWQRSSGLMTLTPHPGEMATLTGLTTAEVQRDRVGTAWEWADRWGTVVVLKGAFTAVVEPAPALASGDKREGRVRLAPFANPGLASGGTGDVLTGVIGSLLAQGLDPFDAASCGVYLHGAAAEMITEERGFTGLLASEVAEALPRAVWRLSPA